MRDASSFGKILMLTHHRATQKGGNSLEQFSVDRKRTLAKDVVDEMFDGLEMDRKISDMGSRKQAKLLRDSYALAMQFLLGASEKKKEPHRKPSIVLGDMDAYDGVNHRILINKSGQPRDITQRMIEETAHSLRRRLHEPSLEENPCAYSLAQEFCGMLGRVVASNSIGIRTGEMLGIEPRWDTDDQAVEKSIAEDEAKIAEHRSAGRWKEADALRDDIESRWIHHIGYSAALQLDSRKLPPLDEIFAMPSRAIVDTYMKKWMEAPEPSRSASRQVMPLDAYEVDL